MPDQSSAATEHAILQEITAPLETLPDDPLSVIDADFPHALRGYDRLAVDEYVRQTRRLVAELQATRSPEAAVRRALQRVGDQITGILQRAHETAEEITAQSRSEAEDRLEQARLEAAQIADAAEQRVKDLDADTDRIWMERQRIVADAEDLAGQLLALAKVAAERFPTDEEAGAPAEELTPYDGAALIAGTPVEAGAPEAEPHAGPEPEPEPEPEAHTEAEFEPHAEPETGAGAHAETGAGAHAEPETGAGAHAEPETAAESGAEGGLEEEIAPEDDDITRTVAFAPLPDTGAQTTVLPEEDEPTEDTVEAHDAPQPRREATTDDDSTGVIRPASQAANRRLGR